MNIIDSAIQGLKLPKFQLTIIMIVFKISTS